MSSPAVERLGKWRRVFAWWQLGRSRDKGDPEFDAVSHHRELSMALRAEMNALTALCIRAGVFSQQAFSAQLDEEADYLSKQYEKKFPGFKAADDGLDINLALARDTMQGWRP